MRRTLLDRKIMTKRSWLIAIIALIGVAVLIGAALRPHARQSIRIGYAISLSGPNTAGAGTTVLSNYRLWAREVNAAGGIMLKSIGKRMPVEIIEYDDQSTAEQSLRSLKRLIEEDHVDFLLPPWGTGLNLSAGPLFHAGGYPQLISTAFSDRQVELIRLWPNSFWFLPTTNAAAGALVAAMAKLRAEGRIGDRVAMVSVADQFGLGFAKAARKALEAGGFEIAYDRPYAVGQLDMQEIVAEAKQIGADCFLAFSYPPDTIAITAQAIASNFNPKLFYGGIGIAYPSFKQRFGSEIEGVMGTGGWDPDTPESQDYRKRHLEASGQEPDRWGSPISYATLQMLQQAIERVGSLDRAAVIEDLKTGTFETILGQIKLDGNMYHEGWLAGQWQDGEYRGVAPAGAPGARPIQFPKPHWGAPR